VTLLHGDVEVAAVSAAASQMKRIKHEPEDCLKFGNSEFSRTSVMLFVLLLSFALLNVLN